MNGQVQQQIKRDLQEIRDAQFAIKALSEIQAGILSKAEAGDIEPVAYDRAEALGLAIGQLASRLDDCIEKLDDRLAEKTDDKVSAD